MLEYISKEVLPYGAIAKISKDTGIPKQTLSDWRRRRTSPGGQNWVPNPPTRPSKYALPKETEDSIYEFVSDNYLKVGNPLTRRELHDIALNAYSSSDSSQVERFAASNSWVDRFLQTHDMTLRKPHVERRTTINEDSIAYFRQRLDELPKFYPPSHVVNFDETSWCLCLSPHKVLAEKGIETVKIKQQAGEKQRLTAFGSITCDGKKLPLWVLAKGKTERCLEKLGNHPEVVMRYSENVWTTESVMIDYLRWLHQQLDERPACLILDVYPSHRTAAVQELANELDIELLYVPAGGTSLYQPLDRRIFGELKSRARRKFSIMNSLYGPPDSFYEAGISVLIQCWNQIDSNNILKAWKIF